jgi:hypothetical protein
MICESGRSAFLNGGTAFSFGHRPIKTAVINIKISVFSKIPSTFSSQNPDLIIEVLE